MLEVDFGSRAVLDLRSIQIHYILNASEASARRHVAAILDGVEMLREFPDMGRVVDDPMGMISPGYRRMLKDDFWIYYSYTDEAITIWRVFHAKQDFDDNMLIDL